MTDDERTPQWPAAVAAVIAAKRSAETRRSYIRAWASWLAHLAGREPETASRGDVLSWLRRLRGQGLGEGTVAVRLAACSAIWQALRAQGLVAAEEENIFSRVGTRLYVDQCQRRTRPLTAAQADQLLSAIRRHTAPGARDYALLGLLLATGARPGAVLALRVRDVRREDAAAVAVVAGRPAPIPVEMYAAVQDYLDLAGRWRPQPDEYLFRPLRNDPAARFGYDLPADRAISEQQLRNIVQRRLAAAGITDDAYTPESLRMTFARQYQAVRPGDIEGLRQRLGHAQRVTTAAWLAV